MKNTWRSTSLDPSVLARAPSAMRAAFRPGLVRGVVVVAAGRAALAAAAAAAVGCHESRGLAVAGQPPPVQHLPTCYINVLTIAK